ncbi:unnamed protein product [Bursaphelenchus xylophilus]|uniref:(pine wood nematode) hypothetical protein n=1 Tax=Bursaphelenchus xylophilus TaxID=6326 RepID=A0A1I7SBJ2_BURXY|nr:unnamed protein product [Bursaphelenchus xylophilus]CAG9121956.1 unnamed protein product [Bursaphelenchus xylophilus]
MWPSTVFMAGLLCLLNAKEVKRTKRQFYSNCPSSCFSCSPASQCQAIMPQFTCTGSCCCPAAKTLTGSCDGEDAVAACLNNLCGQGFFCTRSNYCCRCPVGKSIGNCVNGKCPVGYSCNTNNYCCAVGMIGVAGECVNGKCPSGYSCGDGNLCYSTSTTDGALNSTAFNGTSNTITRLAAHPKPAIDHRPRTIDINTGRFMLGPANNFYNGAMNLNSNPQGFSLNHQNFAQVLAGQGISGFQGMNFNGYPTIISNVPNFENMNNLYPTTSNLSPWPFKNGKKKV